MSEAASHSNTRSAKWATVDFERYHCATKRPFVFSVIAGDDAGNCIHGTTGMARDVAVMAALNILGAAAAIEGLSDEERERLRFLAAFNPI